MRIFYIGQLWEGGTCIERMRILRKFGHEVLPFDTSPWISGGKRLFRSLAHRINFGPNLWGLNWALLDYARTFGHLDLVWVDKGRWIYSDTLNILSKHSALGALHYTPDPQLLLNKSRFFQQCIPLYCWLVTTKPYEVNLYKSLGAKQIIFILQGYDDRFIDNIPDIKWDHRFSSDVCFVGHYEKHYTARLKATAEAVATAKLKIWGPGWLRGVKRHPILRPHVFGNGVWGDDYLRVLRESRIALGLLTKWVPETTSTRTFEIPAVGTFLLAERTEDHLALFEERKEAEFFSCDEELKDKIRFYLKHDEARRRIAGAGRDRCLRSGYSSKDQLLRVLAHVER